MFQNPDSVYHLIRAEEISQTFPFFETFDELSHYPDGHHVHWPPGHSLLIAGIQKLVDSASFHHHIAMVGPILGSILVVLGFFLIGQLVQDRCALILGAILLIFSFDMIQCSQLGNIDHHSSMQIGIMLIFLSLSFSSFGLLAFGLFQGFFFSPEAVFYYTLVFPLVYWGREGFPQRIRPFLLFFPAVMFLLSSHVRLVLDTTPPPFFDLDFFNGWVSGFSWFLSLGLVGVVLDYWGKMPSFTSTLKFPTIWKAGILAILFFLFWIWFFKESSQLDSFFRLSKLNRLLVSEEISPLFSPTFQASQVWYKIHVILFFIFLFLSRKGGTGFVSSMYGGTCYLILISIFEYRHLRVFEPVILCVVATLPTQIPAGWKRAIPIKWGIVFTFVGLIGYHFMNYFMPPNEFRDGVVDSTVRASQWLAEETKEHEVTSIGHGDGAKKGVVSGWDVGHVVRYYSHLPVVLDPLNFPDPIDIPLRQIWGANSSVELAESMKEYQSKWFLFIHPAMTIGSLNLNQSDPYYVFNGKSLVFLNRSYQLAGFRIGLTKGFDPEFLAYFQPKYVDPELMYFDVQTSPRLKKVTRMVTSAAQLFELKRGSLILGGIPESTEHIRVSTRVQFSFAAKSSYWRTQLTPVDGQFSFKTCLPAPHKETTFEVLEPYCFETPNYYSIVFVSQTQVNDGEVQFCEWIQK